jgi:hypothetical protein
MERKYSKTYPKEKKFEGTDWIHLAKDKWQDLVNIVTNLQVPNGGEFHLLSDCQLLKDC